MPKKTPTAAVTTAAPRAEAQVVNHANETEATQSIKLNGKTYHLALNWPAIVEASGKLRPLGLRLTLADIHGWKDVDAGQLQRLFFAAIQDAHPDVSFQEVGSLINFSNAVRVHEALAAAYLKAVNKADGDEVAANG